MNRQSQDAQEFKVEVRLDWTVKALAPGGATILGHKINLTSDPLRKETVDFLVRMMRENRLDIDGLKLLGEYLFDVLLGEEAGLLHQNSLHRTLTDNPQFDFLRLKLNFEMGTEGLASYPWEFLYCPQKKGIAKTGYFLATKAKLVLTRFLELDRNLEPLKVKPPVKILVVVSNPGLNPNGKRELPEVACSKVLEELRGLEANSKGKIKLLQLGEPSDQTGSNDKRDENVPEESRIPTFDNFKSFVDNHEPHIVHFIGHGKYEDKGFLACISSNGWEPDWVDEEKFTNLISDVPSLKLVFLQACESGISNPYHTLAGFGLQLAHANIPAVVVMQTTIRQDIANQFAVAFYKAIVEPKPIDAAVAEGRKKIADFTGDEKKSRGFGIPVLYYRTSDGIIFGENGTEPGQRHLGAPVPGSDPTRSSKNVPCPWCGENQEPEGLYCGDCNRPLKCPNCKVVIHEPKRYCAQCPKEIVPVGEWEKYSQEKSKMSGQVPQPAGENAAPTALGAKRK